MGVERALEAVLAQEKSSDSGIVTYGPLIHNPQVVELLEKRGIRSTRDLAAVAGAERGFISAHGVAPRVRARLKKGRGKVFDASCPDVVKVQAKIKKYAARGYDTVIFGDRGHSEVAGLLGFARGRGHVVSSVAEVASLPSLQKVCLVSQTTQNRKEYAAVARAVRAGFPETVVHETICPSTVTRQEELKKVAARVEAMVVVGGRNSANTVRLARLAASFGLDVFPVESADDLVGPRLEKYRSVGVVGGASTPEWVIQEVVNGLFARAGGRIARRFHRLLNFLAESGLYAGLGAGALTYAAAVALAAGAGAASALAGFFLAVEYISARRFAEQHRPGSRSGRVLPALFSATAMTGVFFSLAAAGRPGWGAAFALLPPAAVFIAFRWRPFASPSGSPRSLPAVREVVKASALAGVAAFVPTVSAAFPASPRLTGGIFALVFVMVFNRSTLLALPMVQKDRFLGWRTLPVVLGVKNAVIAALLLNTLVVAVILSLGGLRIPSRGLWLAPAAYAYFLILQQLIRQKRIYPIPLYQVLIDGQFVVAGLSAFVFGR